MSFIAHAGVAGRAACNQAIGCKQVEQALGGLAHGGVPIRQDIALSRSLRTGGGFQIPARKIGRLTGKHSALFGHGGAHERKRVHLLDANQPVRVAVFQIDQPAEQELRQLAQATRLSTEGLEVLLKGGLLKIQDDARATPRACNRFLGAQNVAGDFQDAFHRDTVGTKARKRMSRIRGLRSTRHRKQDVLGRHA